VVAVGVLLSAQGDQAQAEGTALLALIVMVVVAVVAALSIMAAAILVVVVVEVVGRQERVREVRPVRTEPPATTLMVVPVAGVAVLSPSATPI